MRPMGRQGAVYRYLSRVRLGFFVLLSLTASLGAQENPLIEAFPASTPSERASAKAYSRTILRGVTLKDVYRFNTLWTTTLGPAYANIVEESSNFIACRPPSGKAFSYALCYYSGPPEATGSNSENPALPCRLNPDGTVAYCTCYAVSNEAEGAKAPYLVDINAISNLYLYEQTVAVCGRDGRRCLLGSVEAPVCEAINTNLLVPGADLVSVFSPLYSRDYSSSSPPVTACNGTYAACMTAPCERTGRYDPKGHELVQCRCPVYKGPYQIGQANQSCSLGKPYVWSAAYNPEGQPLPLPEPSCTPDLPGKNGCPLYDPNDPQQTQAVDPQGALCRNVCASYQGSQPSQAGIQVGFSCDATVCTTVGIGQGTNYQPSVRAQALLSGGACSGISEMAYFAQIQLVEALAHCSCCASQICGCSNPNAATNRQIYELNQAQQRATIEPQCAINGTLCGKP